MDRYAVLGNPVAHSLSPGIHAAFAAQAGEAMEYSALLVPEGAFAERASAFFSGGARGANVTLPFKEEAFAFAARRTPRAELAGAVNTLIATASGIEGDNTDGKGLLVDLSGNLGLKLRGLRIVVLGAGGAARGVIAPLLAESPASLVIANRTPARAEELAARFGHLGSVRACSLAGLRGPIDLVINATSSSTRGESLALPPDLFGGATFAYDMAYGAAAGAFLAEARGGGATGADGLGMLVEQAAEAFHLWRGKRPQTAPVLAALRGAR